jgi:uncharacterized protein YfaS (alpha-2-macroglobulin family)
VFHELFGTQASGAALADLVAGALKGKDSHAFTTQELMWGVSGLGKWVGQPIAVPGAKLRFDGTLVSPSRERARADGQVAWQIAGGSLAQSLVLELDKAPVRPLSLVVTTEGVRYDVVPPTGDHGLHLQRQWHVPDGGPAQVTAMTLGDLVYVELTVSNQTGKRVENLALVDRIPAGWEIENPRLGRGTLPDWVDPESLWTLDYMDLKDDRFMVFGGLDAGERTTVVYAVRATTAGTFTMPGASVEAMYDPEIWGRVGPQEGVSVEGPWAAFAL